MKLSFVSKDDVKAGEVLVYRGNASKVPTSGTGEAVQYFYRLAIVVSVSDHETVLSPFTALWDDGDDLDAPGTAPHRVPKSIQTPEFNEFLARPVWELSDELVHRSRPARITETKPNDLHVSIEYTDTTGGQFYGNLIWMDTSPTLNLLRRGSTWPTLP